MMVDLELARTYTEEDYVSLYRDSIYAIKNLQTALMLGEVDHEQFSRRLGELENVIFSIPAKYPEHAKTMRRIAIDNALSWGTNEAIRAQLWRQYMGNITVQTFLDTCGMSKRFPNIVEILDYLYHKGVEDITEAVETAIQLRMYMEQHIHD